jgi:dUTP pyrophosphatase
VIIGGSELRKLITERKPPLISDWVDLDVQLQPAGFDLTVREVRAFASDGYLDFDNSKRRVAETIPIPFDESGRARLGKGAYLLVFNEYVRLPLDVAALAKPRSSLLRSGATVETAVWDPGYEGRGRALLIVYNEHGIVLERNARVVQLVFFKVAGTGPGYAGAYKGES